MNRMGSLGIDIKLPPVVGQMTRELPNMALGFNSIGNALSTGIGTSESVATLAVVGVVIAAVLLGEKKWKF